MTGQVLAAYGVLEAELGGKPLAASRDKIDQAGITTAIAWEFTQQMIPREVKREKFPRLSAHSAACERLAEFAAAPHGEGTYRGKH